MVVVAAAVELSGPLYYFHIAYVSGFKSGISSFI